MLGAVNEKESASASTICASDAVGVIHYRLLTALHVVANYLAPSAVEHGRIGADNASHCSDEDSVRRTRFWLLS